MLGYEQALPGFGDPTVVFIAALFVLSAALDASGVTAWTGKQLMAHAGESRGRLVLFVMALVALMTAAINVNGAVATMLPVVVVLAVRLSRSPSELLMPAAFGAHAGSLLTLTGTPVNVVVAEASADAGVGRFGFCAFALVGVPLLMGTVLVVVAFGERLLPDRRPRRMPADFSRHARTLAQHYRLTLFPDTDGVYVSTGHLPAPARVQALVDEAHARFRGTAQGRNSDVYPALAAVPPDLFRLCVTAPTGQHHTAGGRGSPVRHHERVEAVRLRPRLRRARSRAGQDRVGADATGLPFDSLAAMERDPAGRTNPMVNPGAIATMSTSASGGVNPVTGERVIAAPVCHHVLAAMITSGMYETSGG